MTPNSARCSPFFNTVGSLLGMGVMQFSAPIVASFFPAVEGVSDGGYADPNFYRLFAPVGVVISILLTILAIIGIWEKDQPKYFGLGGSSSHEKVKISEYVAIHQRPTNPMQRLMVAAPAASWPCPSPPTPPSCACCTAA